MTTRLMVSAVLVGVFGSLAAIPIPYHAFCSSLWLFEMPCTKISSSLVKQIEAFSPMIGCDKCHYQLVSATPVILKANHTSPDGLQAENITFTLNPTIMASGCRVSGQSISLGFTSLLDDGLNYCNLYNLLSYVYISASGLTSSPGFIEMTNEWACLGYGLATCKV